MQNPAIPLAPQMRTAPVTDEQRMIREGAAAFFAGDAGLRRVRAQRGRAPGYAAAVWREMAALGWPGLRLPECYGGAEARWTEAVVLFEEAGAALAPEPLAPAMLAAAVLAGGDNAALKARWLPSFAAGEWVPALAWQEAAGAQCTDAASLAATPRGDGVVLDGVKCFVPAGEGADAFIVSARAQGGTALYLVERDAPGLPLHAVPRVDGGFYCELRFDGVAVPASAMVAPAALGARVLEAALDEARLAASAELVGLMSRALEISIGYLKLREQFGRPIGSFQALQHRAADLFIQTELARSVLMRCAALFDSTQDPARRAAAASQVKARCSDAALKVTKGCIQMHGGIGYTDECDIGLFLKRAMVLAEWLGGAAWHRRRYGDLAPDVQIAAAGETSETGALDAWRVDLRACIAADFPVQWRFPPHRLSLRDTEAWHKKVFAKGWAAPGWPKELGGMGLTAYEQLQFQDELDRHGVHIAPNMGVVMLGPLLMRYGTEAQKQRYLPRILSGEILWCQGYSEPGAGSDLAALRTSARLEGDAFVVNGQKIWTSFAHEADMIFLLVRTDPEAKKQEGISFLLADMRSPGVTVKRIRNLTGSSEFCEVFFDNLKVPKDNLVGPLNQGWTMAKSLLGSERITIGNPRLAKFPLQRLEELARARGLLSDPVFRARFDELRLDVEDAGAAFVRFAEVLRRGGELGPEVSLLKIWVTETCQRVADLAIEAGAESATLDAPLALGEGAELHVANLFFAARPATIYGGTNEIQRNIIAKNVLGLP